VPFKRVGRDAKAIRTKDVPVVAMERTLADRAGHQKAFPLGKLSDLRPRAKAGQSGRVSSDRLRDLGVVPGNPFQSPFVWDQQNVRPMVHRLKGNTGFAKRLDDGSSGPEPSVRGPRPSGTFNIHDSWLSPGRTSRLRPGHPFSALQPGCLRAGTQSARCHGCCLQRLGQASPHGRPDRLHG